MNRNYWSLLFLSFWMMMVFGCETRQPPMSYEQEIADHRKETDKFMNEAEDSPFVGADSVIRLNYFPADEKYKVIASINRIDKGSELTLATSSGQPRVFVKHAILEFQLERGPQQLLVLKGAEDEGLFLAFADLTNDKTTYGGGRYINLNFSDQAEKITLDFNKAYNPYCEYNGTYSCPLPPIENYLKIAIEAGEKVYFGD